MADTENAGLLKPSRKDPAYGTHKSEKGASAFETVRVYAFSDAHVRVRGAHLYARTHSCRACVGCER